MITQIEIPERIRFADTQSEINYERAASGEMPTGLLVIEGNMATGKSRLAKHLIELIGEKLRVMYLPNEKSLEHIFNVEKPRLVFFDEVRTSKITLNDFYGTRGGELNPHLHQWLMGWPIGWTNCDAPATASFQQWCRSHGIFYEPSTMNFNKSNAIGMARREDSQATK